MPTRDAQTFMQTLQEIERRKDPQPLVELFSDDAELTNAARQDTQRGREGARTFWSQYLHAFEDLRSKFTNVTESDGEHGRHVAVLEWETDGKLPNGRPLNYRGVSIVETEAGQVKRFRTYYDSAPFLPEGSKHRPDA